MSRNKSSDDFRATLFTGEYGGKTIIIARFVPIVRTFAPIVAGAAGMTYRKFAFFNAPGGFLWVFSMILAEYFLRRAIPNRGCHIEWGSHYSGGTVTYAPAVRVREIPARKVRSERIGTSALPTQRGLSVAPAQTIVRACGYDAKYLHAYGRESIVRPLTPCGVVMPSGSAFHAPLCSLTESFGKNEVPTDRRSGRMWAKDVPVGEFVTKGGCKYPW